MRKNRNRLILIVIAVLLSLYFLWPTYRDYGFTRTLRGLAGEDSLSYVEQNETAIRDARLRRIKLGLDLQGGMRVVLEVNVLKLLEDLARNKDEAFEEIMRRVRAEAQTSEESPVTILRRRFEERQIRMSRYYMTLRATDDEVAAFLEDESVKAIDRGMEIVRNRVDQYGVSEPSIQKLGGSRIIVELPGVTNEAEVRQLLQGTALLEFKLLKEPEQTYRVMDAIDKMLAGTAGTDTSDTARAAADTGRIATPEGELTREEFARKHPFFGIAIIDPQNAPGEAFVLDENREKVRRLLEREDVRRLIPRDMQFLWSAKTRQGGEGARIHTLYAVKSTAELTGGVVVSARANIDPGFNQPIVSMEMNSEGAREWARITGANVNKRIAIVMDNGVFSAPVVRTKIIGGNSQIEGMESIEEARLLEIVLKAGALPAPVEIIEQRSVGPSLGEDSIRNGIISSVLATVLTVLFMALYYRSSGFVADGALVFCVLFILAVLAGFQGTLTLPGIAGIILTLAVAVDANVLIFERVREELAGGKTVRAAIDGGYQKAWTAIFDSNLTTFITGIILYQFGSGPVQGFALTLMIGIVASMFSAIFITRVIFNIITEKNPGAVSFG
ncbi:MAG: protein translocase subunit SecD [Bacteroidota bacterium]